MENDHPSPARIRWQCRRGMLELDIILLRYFDTYFENSKALEQQKFVEFLSFPDPILYQWIIGRETPPAEFLDLVSILRKP